MSDLEEQPEVEAPGCLRLIIGGCVGILPGLLILIYENMGQGIAVIILGGFLGLIFSYKGGVGDLLNTTAATLLKYNLPIVTERIERSGKNDTDVLPLTEDSPVPVLIISIGVLAGVVVGGLISAHDVQSLSAGEGGVLLPLSGAMDTLLVQAVLVTVIFGIWCGTVAGVLSSPPIRFIAACWIGVFTLAFAIIGIAVSDRGYPWRVPFMGATGGAFITLLIALFAERNHRQQK